MNTNSEIKDVIRNLISSEMDKVMNKVTITDPFLPEDHKFKKPLYAALVPDEIFKGSHFERRFVTPFGNLWEKLAKELAIQKHGSCEKGYRVKGMIGAETLRRIQEVLNELEHNKNTKPSWYKELNYIQNGGGKLVSIEVECDIFIDSKIDGKRYAFELKAPLPNSDQTKVSKEKIFKLLSMEARETDYAFFALPYNPYGEKIDYAHTFPMRWFDMHSDPSILIGDEFWDLIGGKGSLDIVIEVCEELGSKYKERINKEYLDIDPLI
jgi:hypothetical protein